MKSLLACILVFSTAIAEAADLPLSDFLERESDESLAREAAKQQTFFLRIVVGGMAGAENASYELVFSGDSKDLDFVPGRGEVTGTLTRRDAKGEERIFVEKYDLAHLVSDCINEELFELGIWTKKVTAPNVLKMDECQVWLYIKYGEFENHLWRTDDSLPVWRTYTKLKRLIRPNLRPQGAPEKAPSSTAAPESRHP